MTFVEIGTLRVKKVIFCHIFQDFAAADISIETRHQLTEALYNELMVAILKILDKLDLSSTAPVEVN